MPQSERHVRLFRNGRNQALRIPREFELEGNEAIIHKGGRSADHRADPEGSAACLADYPARPWISPFQTSTETCLPSLDETVL